MTVLKKILLWLRWSFCIWLFLSPARSFAQQTIKGVVIDSLENLPIDSCTITLKAGNGEVHSLTNVKGIFSFRTAELKDTAFLFFHRNGYVDLKKQLLPGQTNVDTVTLVPDAKMMEAVLIKSRIPAIVQKDDTTEYMVDSFQRRKGMMIGQALKDLPGIEVSDDGKITHNGVPVTEITVNGQTFYDSNGQIALQNLPAEIVAKIQVMDARSKQDVFNNIPSDGQSKTINIKLKSGSHIFGIAEAGGSTRNDYHGNAMLNDLNNFMQASVIGSTNITKTPGFNDTSPSLTTVMKNFGAHHSNKIGKDFMYNGNINFNNNSSQQESQSQVQQFFRADSSFTTNSHNYSENNNSSYSAGGTANFSSTKIFAMLSLSYSAGNNHFANNTSSSILENGLLRNQIFHNSVNNGDNNSASADLSLSKRFKKKGRNLSISFRIADNTNNSESLNYSDNTLYNSGIFAQEDILRQHIFTTGSSSGAGILASFTEPITKYMRLMLSNSFDIGISENRRTVYNIDTITKQDNYDSLYSSHWKATNTKNRTTASVIYDDAKKLSLSAGMTMMEDFSQRVMDQKETITQNQQNYSPSISATYKITKLKVLSFHFSGSTQNPTIDQLQPVPNNSNPLFVFIGNPNLKSSFQQSYNVNYNVNNNKGNMGNVSFGYSPTTNSIVNAVYYDVYRKRTSQYINVDGIYSVRTGWNFTHVIAHSKAGSSWGIAGGTDLGRNVYFDNSSLLYTRNFGVNQSFNYSRTSTGNERSRLSASLNFAYKRTLSPANTSGINTENFNASSRVQWDYSIKEDKLDFGISYTGNYYNASYSPITGDKLNYFNHTISNTLLGWNPTERIGISSLFNYSYNGRTPAGTNPNVFFWTMNAYVRVFKNQSGEFHFSAIDILNSSRNYTSIFGENYISDVQTAKQKTYFTINFQYHWMKKEKKNEKE